MFAGEGRDRLFASTNGNQCAPSSPDVAFGRSAWDKTAAKKRIRIVKISCLFIGDNIAYEV